ncbi:MAG: glycosyltransferase family 4 protein [Spiribacter salinus]|uniref:Glycosyltransferase family 4 protein n=1 Tax=Spiribacter salinus TaxID=1335746 RepID=A0A540VNG4_9GAMM|nr:MAG: glycosyltransferase family 4 protein [Spiribacter salinus]
MYISNSTACRSGAPMKILFLCTDAFGGRGGIAKFNRDLCRALSSEPLAATVTALPRVPPVERVENVPDRVNYRTDAAGPKLTYVRHVVRSTLDVSRAPFDGIICGHINLLPVAAIAALIQRAPLLLILHGIDAWDPHPSALVRWSLRLVNNFVAVSQYTKERFLSWAPLRSEQGHVVPNCIDRSPYGPGPKRTDLLARYGLHDRTILLTLGRLSADEQYKGHDEVLDLLPELSLEVPDIAYLICGDGDDRPRLQAKAECLGIADRVVFAGYVPEEDKPEYLRLADAFVMPGRGEGFGIVYLEALACGIPVVASAADASQEAVLHGRMGQVVDPDNPDSVKAGILAALKEPYEVPRALDYFSVERFWERWHQVVHTCFTSERRSAIKSTARIE